MTNPNITTSEEPSYSMVPWREYLALCKPRVVLLMLITTIVGMYLATSTRVPWSILFWGNLGIGLGASAAAAVNHIADQRIDALMHRTQFRPLPTGRLSVKQAILFALCLGALSMLILSLKVNPLTAWLTLLTLIGYAGVYTLYLKRATPQNIVIGGVAGATPPLLGWAAVTGHIDAYALLLVLIIFTWTPPHFWALAIQRHQEYAKADIPMLPVTHGIPFTKRCILLYTLLLFAISLLPYATGMSGMLYLMGAITLGLIFIYKAMMLWIQPEHLAAGRLFRFSIWYLFLLFTCLLMDHYR